MIEENLKEVKKNIEEAAKKAGRDPEEVTLIAVSKTKPVEMLQEAYDLGCRHFGENKVQELTAKIDALPGNIHWHMIGHLQTNKVKYIVGKVDLIHSVDTFHLAQAINREAQKKDCVQDILIEINVAGEESKFGTSDRSANLELIRSVFSLSNINICGLMTIAPYTENAEDNRIYFKELRRIAREDAAPYLPEHPVLSMGMTGDYAVAIEEGATCVRVGTGIFGERNYAI